MIRVIAIAVASVALSGVLVVPALAAQPEGGCIIFCDKPSSKVPRSKGGDCLFFCPQQSPSKPLPEWHWPSNRKNPPAQKHGGACPDGHPPFLGVC